MLAYDSIWNQAFHLLHFLFAFWLLGIAFPRFLFAQFTSDRLSQLFANYMKMMAFLIGITYILVLTKLYEVISVTAIILLVAMQRYVSGRKSSVQEHNQLKWVGWAYDYFEGLIELKGVTRNWLMTRKASLLADLKSLAASTTRLVFAVLLVVTLLITAYIRFYDATHSAVPGTSDGNVTLAWMKYLDSRILFHDGFYPAGFHIFLSLLLKYANIDGLYITKYTGPFNMMLLCIGYYFFVSRITANKVAGLCAILVFGLLGPLIFESAYSRQAATNSQEFTFLFVLPSLFFYLQYLKDGKRAELLAAASGTATIGLAHEVAFTWVGLGMMLMLVIQAALDGFKQRARMFHICIAGMAAVVVTIIPLLLSMLLKVGQHSTSAKFATAKVMGLVPNTVRPVDYITVGITALMLLFALFRKGTRSQKVPETFIAAFIGMTFLIFKYAHLANNEAVSSRSLDVWVLCIPLAAGMGWHALFSVFAKVRWKMYMELVCCAVSLAATLYWVPVKPIITDKMEGESAVRQYLRISSDFLPKTFMIVSPRVQEYGIVLGKGMHMYLAGERDSLLSNYDPTKTPLTRYGEDKPAPVPPNIFIYYEKHVYGINHTDITEQRRKELRDYQTDYDELQNWLQKYRETHSGEEQVTVYYDDPDLTVYYLRRKPDQKEALNKIWS